MSGKRTVLVTGCSDGSLGSALALALHKTGWRVFASARSPSKLAAAKTAGIECIQLDVCSEESIASAVKQMEQLTGGSLDAIVNNAGGGYGMPIIHVDIDSAHELFELNVFSIIRVTRAFLPMLLNSDRGAMVFNSTSGSGLLGGGVPFQGAYNASKAAAVSLTESLRMELAPFGVRVSNLVIGAVSSNFFSETDKWVLPEDSIYNLAKEAIEGPMAGDQPGVKRTDTEAWARQVAVDISGRSPPYMVFRGSMAGLARIVTLLPIGLLDRTFKRMSGIDVLERNIRSKGGLGKVKQGL